MNDATTSGGGITKSPIGMLLIGLAAGLLVAYGIGLWQRNAALAEQADAHAAIVSGKDAELAAAGQRLAEAEQAAKAEASRLALVQARLGLYQALSDLDQRNFGTASDRIRDAAGRFENVDAASLGLDSGLLAALREEIATTQVLVATDLNQQRARLLELAARIEGQSSAATVPAAATTPAEAAPEGEPAPAEAEAVPAT